MGRDEEDEDDDDVGQEDAASDNDIVLPMISTTDIRYIIYRMSVNSIRIELLTRHTLSISLPGGGDINQNTLSRSPCTFAFTFYAFSSSSSSANVALCDSWFSISMDNQRVCLLHDVTGDSFQSDVAYRIRDTVLRVNGRERAGRRRPRRWRKIGGGQRVQL